MSPVAAASLGEPAASRAKEESRMENGNEKKKKNTHTRQLGHYIAFCSLDEGKNCKLEESETRIKQKRENANVRILTSLITDLEDKKSYMDTKNILIDFFEKKKENSIK